jgi:hypothetical protein
MKTSTAEIRDLQVTHWSPRTRLPGDAGPGLFIDTCLRQVYVDLRPTTRLADLPSSGRHAPPERTSGIDAYQLLLEITTGLRSAVPGETNVFGQFKNAWLAFRSCGKRPEVARLAPFMHRLINDTKAIRTKHLHGIGGASYGSLVRKLVAPRPEDRILFVGAGNLAQSMLPLFRNFDVGLWNRSPLCSPPESVSTLFRPEHGRHAARWADHLILTTPPDSVNDGRWHEWIAAAMFDAPVKTIVHLGYRDASNGGAGRMALSRNPPTRTYDLEDVLALQRVQNDRRSTRLAHARAACRERAEQLIPDDRGLGFGCLETA